LSDIYKRWKNRFLERYHICA